MGSKMLLVARRDFRQTVMRKAFLITLLGIPVLIAVVGAVAALILLSHEEPPLAGTIAVIAPEAAVAEAAKEQFERERVRRREEPFGGMSAGSDPAEMLRDGAAFNPGSMPTLSRGDVVIEIEHVPAQEAAVETLRERLQRGELLAVVDVPAAVLAPPDPEADDEPARFTLLVGEDLSSDHTGLIERTLGSAIVRVRAATHGIDADEAMAMLREPPARTQRLLASGESTSESETVRELRQMVPLAFMMLLWIATFTGGQHLMMSTIEEKSNRVMEVLLSAVSPLQLMTGKILAQGAVGLLIVGIYSALGIGMLVLFATMRLIEPIDLVYLAVYFFMAYFMIASVMAAVGSAVSDIREANTLMTPVMLVLMVPLMLWLPITHDPNGVVAVAFSFIPPAIPFAMILRVGADEALPWWQIPATIVWGYICVALMIWGASKIFRIGVLMYGKPPSLWQLLKWLRYG